jgi:hypothetical protein
VSQLCLLLAGSGGEECVTGTSGSHRVEESKRVYKAALVTLWSFPRYWFCDAQGRQNHGSHCLREQFGSHCA